MREYFRNIYQALRTVIIGMRITLKYAYAKPITVQYPDVAPVLSRLLAARQQARLSQAAMETVSIISYRQPVLRAEIEAIRGVACGDVLRGLLERRLIRIAGRAEELGRPMLYGTTKEFLKVFGLSSPDDLPSLDGDEPNRKAEPAKKTIEPADEASPS